MEQHHLNLEIMKQLVACGITSMYKTFNSSLVSALVLVESVCVQNIPMEVCQGTHFLHIFRFSLVYTVTVKADSLTTELSVKNLNGNIFVLLIDHYSLLIRQ